jgi:UDP-glucose 4-epimerase
VHSTTAVLESAAIIGQCKVVLTAAADSFYGNLAPRDVPVKEGYAGPPGGVRGLLSRQLVEMCQLYREAHAVEFSALVLGEVYGPRQRADGGLVAQLRAAQAAGEAARLPGDDRYTRDFVFVDDAVDALARSLAKADGLVVNIGTGVATPVRELWAMLGGHHTELLPDSEQLILRNALAATRARIQLGWSAWTTLAEGVLALR